MIRLLLDQGLPRSTCAILLAEGWDVVHVGDTGMSQATDPAILDYAARQASCRYVGCRFSCALGVVRGFQAIGYPDPHRRSTWRRAGKPSQAFLAQDKTRY